MRLPSICSADENMPPDRSIVLSISAPRIDSRSFDKRRGICESASTSPIKRDGSWRHGSIFMVLRCLAWVATISVWKHEIEFGCEQVNHGFEVAD